MFDMLRHPIWTIRAIYRLMKDITPEEVAEFNAAKDEDEQEKIAVRITNKRF